MIRGQVTDPIPEAETPAKPKFGKQQIIATVLTILILVLVFVIILPQFGNYDEAWEAVQSMSTASLALIVVATIAMIVIYTTPFIAALPGLKFKPAFLTRQTSFMISNVVPAGGAFGLAVQFGMLSSYGYRAAPVTAVIGITSVWNTLITLSLPVVALAGLAITGQSGTDTAIPALIAAAIVAAMIIVFALILRSEELARKIGRFSNGLIQWAARIVKREVPFDAVDAIVQFRTSIVDVVSDRWILITLSNVGQQLAQFSILYLAVVALQGGIGGPITLLEAFAAFAFGRLATFIPVPPGGVGTTDAIIVGMLGGFGLDSSSALAATMIWRFATYMPQVLIGGGALIAFRRGQSRRQKAPSSV